MENNRINIEILNDLIEINNDRIVGYQKASEELQPEDNDLKPLFAEMIVLSQNNKSALTKEVQVLGAEPEAGTTNSGKIYRAWMDIKAVFAGHDRETVLANCEFGEDAAKRAYKMALETEGLSSHLVSLISSQQAAQKAAHDQIKAIRDQVVR
ncbi:conserved hypothetical protein [Pedobacter steynii]|uniref:DUF2383 domain-containing protein n=1 Tax=Pedobacter steynii TaxID=430522 RepID=A0A1H0CM41_9SPHI|nr:PA2169 family four-helix-bundle protein [Pedobacter steynii]NQX41606.1 PA2169 family four-helix-bundle protein [Pedobacter steynii]SDN58929.1 conserved hypothetical protein [Pedobacter steynii]